MVEEDRTGFSEWCASIWKSDSEQTIDCNHAQMIMVAIHRLSIDFISYALRLWDNVLLRLTQWKSTLSFTTTGGEVHSPLLAELDPYCRSLALVQPYREK